MRLNPFAVRGKRGQTPAQVRRERDELAADKAALQDQLAAAREIIAELEEQRDWFHAKWIEVGHRDIDSSLAVAHLDAQLTEALKKLRDLEAIAGPHVDAADTPSPIFSEVTQEIPLPQCETTLSIPVMSLVALGARS